MPALIIVIIDQATKHLVRTTPGLQDLEIIPGWLAFHYTKNPGMALGMDWASTPIISSIAILATIGIIIYILRTLDNANIGYLACMGLVLGGAFGNIIDRLVMGYVESNGGLLEGHVIDFVHFTLQVDGYPVFPYIFNVADISISLAIISLLLFHNRILPVPPEEDVETNAPASADKTAAGLPASGGDEAPAPVGGTAEQTGISHSAQTAASLPHRQQSKDAESGAGEKGIADGDSEEEPGGEEAAGSPRNSASGSEPDQRRGDSEEERQNQ